MAANWQDILEQLGMVGRDDPGDCFRMLTTENSYEGHDIVRAHLKAVDQLLRRRDWPGAFTLAAALLRAVRPGEEEFWYMVGDSVGLLTYGTWVVLWSIWAGVRRQMLRLRWWAYGV